MKVPFLQPAITEEDIQEAVRVLRSGWLVLSKETKAFEEEFAAYMGTKEAVLTNSCTCSIHMSLALKGLKPGDEVISTPLTYVSSVTPVLQCGATIVFVDVDEGTGLIRPDLVEKAVTKKTKGIIPVHLHGQMADMKTLKTIADTHNLFIVEDAAHAIEAERDGVRPGQLSLSATFSFHTAKNLTAGQGGALITNDQHLASEARIMRRDGVRNIGVKRRMDMLGFKYLSTDFDAALLRSQLKRLDKQWERRKELRDRYVAAFTAAGIDFSRDVPGSKHACHMLVIFVDPAQRDRIIVELNTAGIDTSIHYDPVHLEPYFVREFGYKEGDFPVAERLGHSTITLPLHPLLTNEQQDFVIEQVKKAVGV